MSCDRTTVIIDGRLIGYRHGGIAKYARKLAELIPARALDLHVITAVSRHKSGLGGQVLRTFTPPHHRLEHVLLPIEIMRHNPTLIHSTDNVPTRVLRARSVVTVHDLAFLRATESVTAESFRHYSRILQSTTHVAQFVAVSDWTRRSIIELLGVPEERISVIHNGLDHETFRPDVPANADRHLLESLHPLLHSLLRSGRKILLFVGTIEPRKRLDLLLEMIDHIATQNSEPPVLLIAGQSGWLADQTITRIRSLQRAGLVVWLRDVPDGELAALYRVSDLLLLPSAEEGFGFPVVEAMASGTPVVTSGNGALDEIGGRAAFQVRTADPQAWARTVEHLLAAPDRLATARELGLCRAADFSWERCAEETIEVYRKVLSSG